MTILGKVNCFSDFPVLKEMIFQPPSGGPSTERTDENIEKKSLNNPRGSNTNP